MKIRDTVLPVLRPVGGEEEIASIAESIKSGWWGKGPKVAEFEKKFAEMVGAKYAVAVTSATHGQDLVFKALEIKDCDIINPTISFMTTAVVPLWNNCTSNIVDVRPEDLATSCPSPWASRAARRWHPPPSDGATPRAQTVRRSSRIGLDRDSSQ